MIKRKILFVVLAMIACLSAESKITLPSVIADGMVLEQNANVRLWGTSSLKKSRMTVKASWADDSFTCSTDDKGSWQVEITTPAASFTPQTVEISDGEQTVTISNVLIGEVWLASGQSNMEMPLCGFYNCPVEGSAETILRADDYEGVRVFTVEKAQSYEPLDDCRGQWLPSSAQYAANFSATAYHFATTLSRSLRVPVGVVVCAFGGSRVESWTPRHILEKYPDINLSRQAIEQETAWTRPLLMYNAMFHPIAPYTYNGILWYQGESNIGHPENYAQRLKTMVAAWRKEMRQGELPFFTVEIAPFAYYGGNGPLLREQQHLAAQSISNAACVSTVDLVKDYEKGQIHPCQKRQVGMRLALTALKKCYHQWWINCEGPTYKSMEVRGNKAVITFLNADGGFSRMEGIVGFEVAGSDRVFHPADTVIVGDKHDITVSSSAVAQPIAVRYGFHDFPVCNLFGVTGLPVVPFRSVSEVR